MAWLRRPSDVLSLIVPLSLSAAMMLWIASKGYANFDSDQSLAGLMALHMKRGEFAAYAWGQSYFGMIFLPLTLLSMHIFGETSVLALRLPMILLSLMFEVGFYVAIRHVWGARTAGVSLLFIAVPGIHMLRWFSFHVYPIYALAALVLLWIAMTPEKSTPMRSAVAGVLAGFGAWTSPVFAPYIFASILLAVRGMPEWPTFFEAVKKKKWLLLALLAGIGLVLWPAMKSNPHQFWTPLLRGGIAIAALGFALLFFISKRKEQIAVHVGCIAGGVLLGALPMIQYAIDTGATASLGMHAVLPTWAQTGECFRVIVPTTLGIPALSHAESLPETAAFAAGTLIAVTFLLIGLKQAIPSVQKLCSMSRMTLREMTLLTALIMFALTYVAGFLRGSHVEGQTRFFIDVLAVNALFMALGWEKLRTYAWRTATTLLLVLLCTTAYADHKLGQGPGDQTMKPAHVREIRDYFAEHEVTGGYGNYWTTFVLTYFLNEETVLAPYNGNNRYPPYAETAGRSNPYAVVLNGSFDPRIPEDKSKLADLLGALDKATVMQLPDFAFARERLARGSVVDRKSIGEWDVWILVDKTPPAVQ